MATRLARQWWTQSHAPALLASQDRLFQALVPKLTTTPLLAAGMNAVQFTYPTSPTVENDTRPACVVTHGFGSGLGFFYSNVEALLRSGNYRSVTLVDWLGMGGSERPPCRQRPYRSMFQTECTKGWCDSHHTTTEDSVNFFVDPLEEFLGHHGFEDGVCLVGHSLGGYLAARYALKYPSRLSKLVLASPVGLPNKPENILPSSQMPNTFRLIDSLWSANITPQSLVRMQGATRGRRSVQRAVQGRIPGLSIKHANLLADYLFHITVAAPSGEFAMNSLLEPAISPDIMGVFAREPLEDHLVSDLHSSIDLRINFGDHDWMRTNEPSARKVVAALGQDRSRLDIVPNAGHHLYLENGDAFNRSILT